MKHQNKKEIHKTIVEHFYWLLDNKQYAAWFFFILMAFTLFFRNEEPKLFFIAFLGYLAAITALIVKTYKNTEEVSSTYDSLQSATHDIHAEIEHALKSRSCEICWIGVTMQLAWLTLENRIRSPINSGSCRNLKLRLLQSAPEYLRAILKSDAIANQTSDQFKAMVDFCEARKKKLRETRSEIHIAQYAYMPNYHGVLIDRKVLFISNIRWEEPDYCSISVPHEPFERFDNTTARGEYMIKLYLSWLEYGFNTASNTYRSMDSAQHT